MNYADLRVRVRGLILAIAGAIIAVIAIRVGLDLLGASKDNVVVNFIVNLSNFFITPFNGLVELPDTVGLKFINTDAIIAAIVYGLGAIAISEIITGFMYENVEDIIQNIVDGLFKVVEFLLLIRIVFQLFGIFNIPTAPQFVHSIYGLTDWSQGIISATPPFLSGKIDISAMIALAIIVILDLLAERFLNSLFKQVRSAYKSVTTTTTKIIKPVVERKEKVVVPAAPAPQPMHQSIVINVPVQPAAAPGSAPAPMPNVTVRNVAPAPDKSLGIIHHQEG